jgi:hypothetical protein
MSCYLNINDQDSPKGQLAFRTAANIIAYATGLELPPPKEITPEVLVEQPDPILRNVFQAAQIQYGRDWQPAPKAMTNLTTYLLKEYKLDVIRQTRPIPLSSPNLFTYRFLYMHGRRAFTSGDEPGADIRRRISSIYVGTSNRADCCWQMPAVAAKPSISRSEL